MRAGLRIVAGLLLGFCTAPVELLFLLLVRAKPLAIGLAELERRRLRTFLGADSAAPTGEQALRYLAVRAPVGLLGGFVLAWLFYGLYWVVMIPWFLTTRNLGALDWSELAWTGLVGLVLLYIEVQGIAGIVALERKVARRFLGPSEQELLRRRIDELAASRAGIVEAVDAERRRIERDLHDGVQQRLVALGMLLGRARRHSDLADALVGQAHEETQRVLEDLREVAWRVYPTALDSLGLDDALAAVADRSVIQVELRCAPSDEWDPHVRTAVYFVVCEAVTNAAKHSGAARIAVALTEDEKVVRLVVEDDGVGGADPSGGGLAGLSRRVLALDGRFRVDSPPAGPTVISAEFPCG